MEDIKIENKRISNKYYNLGLKRAKERNLFDATLFLKKAVLFNNKNINARNLLALIFYEEGATTDAIVQWLISRGISKEENNIAINYLKELEKDDTLEQQFQSIKIYNNAIDDIRIERQDLAIVKLHKAISLNEHNVKAMMLISLLYLKIGEYIKAGSFLVKCQNIDKGNHLVNKLMNFVIKNTKKGEIIEKKIKNIYSIKQLESDDAIIPRKYIKLSDNQKHIYILLGLIIGGLSYALLLSPRIKSGGSVGNDQELVKFANMVNDQNKKIRDLNIENEELKEKYEDASIKLKAYEEKNKLFTSQYEMLNSIIADFDSGYISRASKNYVELDKESITDESLIILLNQAKSRIEGIGAKRLCELGTESWNGGNKNAAISYYQLSLSINPDDPETMFLLARLYQNLDRNKEANTIFDKIIAQHPSSSYAKRAREARGY